MGEYTEIQGQIARVRNAFSALFGLTLTATRIRMGVDDTLTDGPFYAGIGDWNEHRPTLAGALLALESHLANELEDRIAGLKRLEELRATLKLPEIVIGGGK